jgi:hypothetical protein
MSVEATLFMLLNIAKSPAERHFVPASAAARYIRNPEKQQSNTPLTLGCETE